MRPAYRSSSRRLFVVCRGGMRIVAVVITGIDVHQGVVEALSLIHI